MRTVDFSACYDFGETLGARWSIRLVRQYFRFRLLLALFFCLAALPSRAQVSHQASTINVSGVVFSDQGNKRIQGAVVQLCTGDGRMIEERRTRALGEFTFPGLSPGAYTFQVTAPGYEPTQFKPDARLTRDQSFTIYMKSEELTETSTSTSSPVSAHVLSMPQKARGFYETGMQKLYNERDATGALEEFQKAMRKAPSFYEAEFQSGMASLSMGKGAEAETNFRKSIEMSGDKFPDANMALGVLLLDRGDLVGASAQLHHALEVNPAAWMACLKLGDIAYRQGNYPEAETWAKKAGQIEPTMPMVHQLLAEIHIKQKDYPAAIEDIDAYLALDADSANAVRLKELRVKLQSASNNQ
jgi:tetratricopeptide (TPR) repeat protein